MASGHPTATTAYQPATAIPWSVSDPMWGAPRHGMQAQIVHRVELVRHGESNSNKTLTENGDPSCDPDPTLTEWGDRQAQCVADFYERVSGGADMPQPDLRIEVSPFRRAIGTSLPTQRIFKGVPVERRQNIREQWSRKSAWVESCDTTGRADSLRWLCSNESHREFRDRVQGVVQEWKGRGSAERRGHTIAFTHSQFISAVLTHLIPLASHEEEPSQFFHIPNGSITVLDFDTEGRMHVHCVGYTEHLRQPTGQHTAHVDIYPKTHLSGPWSRGQSSGWTPTSLKPKPAARSPDAYVPPHLRLGATPP
jgi:broad specificity phosphatase PhoE